MERRKAVMRRYLKIVGAKSARAAGVDYCVTKNPI
jgi:hypothetical protein